MSNEYVSAAIEKVINYLGSKGVKLTAEEIRKNSEITDMDEEVRIAFIKGKDERIDKIAYGKKCLLFDSANLFLSKYYIEFSYTHDELSKPETSEKELEKVMAKIQKLLAVTQNNGASENEAVIAATKAQNLMKQYDLDYASLNGKRKEDIVNTSYMTNVSCVWQYRLASEVGHAYCCHSMHSVVSGLGSIIKFRGYKSDTIIARRMYVYLHETALRLGRRYDREHKGYGKSKLTVYCEGFVIGVSAALRENCRKLALVIPEDVEKEWAEYSAALSSPRKCRQVSIDADALQEGISDGRNAIHGTYLEAEHQKLTTEE